MDQTAPSGKVIPDNVPAQIAREDDVRGLPPEEPAFQVEFERISVSSLKEFFNFWKFCRTNIVNKDSIGSRYCQSNSLTGILAIRKVKRCHAASGSCRSAYRLFLHTLWASGGRYEYCLRGCCGGTSRKRCGTCNSWKSLKVAILPC